PTPPGCPARHRNSLPVFASQRRMSLSCPQEAMVLPSGEYASPEVPPGCPAKRRTSAPAATSHIEKALPGPSSASSVLPSGENTTQPIHTPSLLVNLRSFPVRASQRRIAPSVPPVASVLPSGE